jgi:hypothetical protein
MHSYGAEHTLKPKPRCNEKPLRATLLALPGLADPSLPCYCRVRYPLAIRSGLWTGLYLCVDLTSLRPNSTLLHSATVE